MLLRSVVHPSSGVGAGVFTGEQPGNCGRATGMELISGPKKSSTPLPLGPLVHSYEGCLSVQAVHPPLAFTTSKMVLTRRYWCGKIGWQVVLSRGRKSGLMPPPPLSWVKSISTPSSSSTTAPPVLGQGPLAIPMTAFGWAGNESFRLKVTSYQKPVVIGDPPVTSEARPGKESEGCELEALV